MKNNIILLLALFALPCSVFASPKTNIPVQIDINHPQYKEIFNYTAQFTQDNMSQCALFVNRMFLTRFGKPIYGNAWDMQLHPANKKHLTLAWQIPKSEVYRTQNLNFPWGKSSQRGDHFSSFYEFLDAQEYPIGVLGMVYRYSAHKEEILGLSNILPQTHVAFIAGKKQFFIHNTTTDIQSAQSILEEQYGTLKSYEKELIASRIPLDSRIYPGESMVYEDYLVEEHFKTVMSGSLIELILRKHRNNRVDELLRPISFSLISQEIIDSLKTQTEYIQTNNLEIISHKTFTESSWAQDEQWISYLRTEWNIHDPSRSLFIPVPKPTVNISDQLQNLFPHSLLKKRT